ncbi:nitroreductase/quinone reductase family protein [Antrihabitans sp. YC2-6]|uniref:nitroreductase/quinone reductase family protein n=1 Tax=Antrihabitans sp. YC2-6 TaxID=2799498 RepID=UPI0018F76C25|nr:nitroreductase/quinone reductase family protein [Antrihabitans sp. YC2-6]MBJ8345008.1 nitroreductase family deazaflavin-dependent oxidoreductase [Antrihabitans sp. YC2-6]
MSENKRSKTVLGTMNHYASSVFAPGARAFSRFHARMNGNVVGKVLDLYFRAPTFALTVRGRKSGQPRTVMLILTRRGDDILVGGSNGGNPKLPAWYLNLRDAGVATVQVAGEEWAVTFREVEGTERDECWTLLNSTYRHFDTYQQLTDRKIPVAVLERA